MNKSTNTLFLTAIVLVIGGCSSTENTNASKMGMNIPSWVTNPTVQSGLVASSCVPASNSFSMDKTQASTQARTELATQINTRIASLQEEYASKVTTLDETQANSTFNVTTAQLTDQALQGSKIVKVDYAQLGNQKNLCTMVTISEENTKALFTKVMKQAPVKLDPENETLLYLSFSKSENIN
ncbi:LPP20 family lipoprotein [Thalassotalea sp. PLHSN55]|uniref:LPP20 family lipoprotein n=1 Tax=Thalassotalea sp. PLHSN55 TaxID=3435888 RepID=UPI003F837302